MNTDTKVWVLLVLVFIFSLLFVILAYAYWRLQTRVDFMKMRIDLQRDRIDRQSTRIKTVTDHVNKLRGDGERERIVRGDN